MCIIAIFHFTWHWNYYKNIIFSKKQKEKIKKFTTGVLEYKAGQKETSVKIESTLKLPIVVLGISAIITQIILLREFLSVFYGNELVIGIILANWMLLTGAGSYLGKFSDRIKNKVHFITFSLIFIAILPIITVFLLSSLRNIVFPVGSMISIISILYSSFILLMPYCLLSGFLFTLFCNVVSEKYQSNLINKVYSYEAIGSIAG
ncbi:unnamed protein product, partial [marine sediment metagenome]